MIFIHLTHLLTLPKTPHTHLNRINKKLTVHTDKLMKTKKHIKDGIMLQAGRLFNQHKLSTDQLDMIIFNAYESIRSTVNRHYHEDNLSDLRKLFISKSYKEYNDPLVEEMTDECVRRTDKKIGIPIMLNRKITEAVIKTELKEINRHFKCNSFSKLLRYFSVANSFMTNEFIRQRTAKKFEMATAHSHAHTNF